MQRVRALQLTIYLDNSYMMQPSTWFKIITHEDPDLFFGYARQALTLGAGLSIVQHGAVAESRFAQRLAPGVETTINLRSMHRYRLAEPYGRCENEKLQGQSGIYTVATCTTECFIQTVCFTDISAYIN